MTIAFNKWAVLNRGGLWWSFPPMPSVSVETHDTWAEAFATADRLARAAHHDEIEALAAAWDDGYLAGHECLLPSDQQRTWGFHSCRMGNPYRGEDRPLRLGRSDARRGGSDRAAAALSAVLDLLDHIEERGPVTRHLVPIAVLRSVIDRELCATDTDQEQEDRS